MRTLTHKLGKAISLSSFKLVPHQLADFSLDTTNVDNLCQMWHRSEGFFLILMAEVYLRKSTRSCIIGSHHTKAYGREGGNIICNGWKGHTNRHLISFLVYCNKTTMFFKSKDATNISRDANYYLTVIDRVVENIG